MNQRRLIVGVLGKYGKNLSLRKLKEIHGQAVTLGLCNHQTFACKLLNAYSNLNQPLLAHSVFTQIHSPDAVSWTCLISLYLHLQLPNKAFYVFSQLLLSGIKPDTFSIVGGVSACGRMGDLRGGKIVHAMIFRFGLWVSDSHSEPIVGNALIDMYSRSGQIKLAQRVFNAMEANADVASWTSLLSGYVKCGDLESARHLFDKMPLRNAISWTAMISGYVRGETPIRALELFQQMTRTKCKEEYPNDVTVVAVLSGCADVGAFDLGQSLHGFVEKNSMIMDVAVKNALVDLYSKSGNLDLAVKIFDKIEKKDVFSWTSMISGLALHGKGSQALEMLNNMLESGISPNEVTILSALSACSHAGLVVEGKGLFKRLMERYNLKPKIEHYGCLVDLLGRAGLLDEAIELIEGMPINPDAVIWRSLLSACLGHRSLNLAEMAARKILEVEPDDDGVYILLWNIYCSENRWEDALKTRKAMRDEKIKKKPGCSWIEVNGCVHEFLSCNPMHQHHGHAGAAEMYFVLQLINLQSKSECLSSAD
ncbi:hypothetical protein NMG60_11021639 [Bertholletia excelsa]